MQRQLSAFDIYVIVHELQDLLGSFVEKIYHLSRNEIIIKIKDVKSKKKEIIFIRNGSLLCLTNKDFETPIKPTTFVMTLRKYLQNGRITDISQHEFDRIIKIKIRKKEGEFTLVIELFSNGNIILVNPDGKIILPLIKQTWASRTLKGQQKYTPPPSQTNPFELSKEKFVDLIKNSDTDIVRTLAIKINLSGHVAEEICFKSNINKDTKIQDIDSYKILEIFDILKDFLTKFQQKTFSPVLVEKDEETIDVLPFIFNSYKSNKFKEIEMFVRGLEKFIDTFYKDIKKESQIEKSLAKLDRQMIQQNETVKKLKKEIHIKKLEGDLIYLNYQQLDNILNEIGILLEKKEKNELISNVNKNEIVKKFEPTENNLIVMIKDTDGEIFEIKLNFRKSVSKNAEKAYNDNKKLQKKLKGALKAIKNTHEQIDQLKKKKVIEERKIEEKIQEKKEKVFWFEKFRWFISTNGNIVIGGKDAKSNEYIVKKYLKEGDRYAHADIQGAPSVIVKSKGPLNEPIDIDEKTLEESCIFASSYSKAWKQFAETQAYWVNPEQVSKTAQSGEFVPKGAFIIRGKRNYQKCKLEIAIGPIKIDNQQKMMAGPVDSVKKRASRYITLEPGGTKKIEVAKKISKAFNIHIDQIERLLPPGGVTILNAVGVNI
jgi:predicted ribosome quality control (RQC) complex YloA/Tae2 family protein